MTAAATLVQLAFRIATGVVLAVLVALLIATFREDARVVDGLAAGAYLVGCLALLLAVTGHSHASRAGTVDPWLGSFFPKLLPVMRGRYARSALGDSALIVLTAAAMLALGALFDSR